MFMKSAVLKLRNHFNLLTQTLYESCCVDIVRPYHSLEYVSGCKAVKADIFVIGEDWGRNAHNLDVDAYLKKTGKEITQVRYNPRTSSTQIKQIVWAQFQAPKH